MRENLACHYLASTEYSGSQIALLPGYDDPNSFFRAFLAWTGPTSAAIRSASRRDTRS